MIKKENNYYKKYNGNKTKEIVIELKLQVDENLEGEDLNGLLDDIASETICDDVKSISVNLKK